MKVIFIHSIKIDTTTTANSNTALTYAAENGHLDVCALLIESGANIVSSFKFFLPFS